MGVETRTPRSQREQSKRTSLSSVSNLQKDHCVILPERSRPLWKWDTVCAVLLVLVAVLTPFEAGFLEGDLVSPIGVFNILTNAFFFADMVLQFFIAYPIETRYGPRWVQIKKMIALRYLRGWFLIDLMSTLPLDYLSPGTGLGLLRTIRLLRLLKLLRLARGIRVVRRYQAEFGVSYRKSTLYLLFISVLAVSHWIACTLGVMHKFQIESEICSSDDVELGSTDCSITWLSEGLRWHDGAWSPDERPSISIHDAYIMSFYTGITILVHPHAYTATGTGERIFFTILLLIGGFMWTQVISRSTAIASSLNAHKLAHQQTMDDLNMIADRLSLPHEMKVRLRKFFLRSTAQHEYQAWQQILERMSPQLRRDTYREVNVHWVKKVRFLDKCSTSFLTCIAEILEMRMFGEQEHFGKLFHMYIMMGGTASRVMNFTILVPGMVWGEDHLLLSNPDLVVSNIAVSLTVVEVQELSKACFEEILEDFPEHVRDLRQVSIKYIFMRGLKRFARITVHSAMKERNSQNQSPWDKNLSDAGKDTGERSTTSEYFSPLSQSLKDGAHHIKMQYMREKRSSDLKNDSKETVKPALKGKDGRRRGGVMQDAVQAATVAWYSPMDAASAATAAAVQATEHSGRHGGGGGLELLRRQDTLEESVLGKLNDLSMQMYGMWEVLQDQQEALAQLQAQSTPRRSPFGPPDDGRLTPQTPASMALTPMTRARSLQYGPGMFRSLPAVPQKPDHRLSVTDQLPDFT